MKLADFEGLWQITRQIDDRRALQSGTLTGTAVFTPEAQGLHYREQGRLRFAGQPALDARQSYLWRTDDTGIAVFFADGRPFHHIAFGAPQARHWCDPDHYDVTYEFSRWPDWAATWQVKGPRKDYAMTTQYRRA